MHGGDTMRMPLLPDHHRALLADAGLLLLRAWAGLFMLVGHGWSKLADFERRSATFSDPLGVGSGTSLAMAVFAEVFCSAAVVLGVATRVAAVPLVVTMGVAAGVVHAHDPWAKKEFALMFALPFVVLVLTGPGRFSVDAWWRDRARPRA